MKEKLKELKNTNVVGRVRVGDIAGFALTLGIIVVYGKKKYDKGFKDGVFELAEASLLRATDISTEEKANLIDRLHKNIYGK